MLVSTCIYFCSYVYMYVVVCPPYCNRRVSPRHLCSIPQSDAAVSTPTRGVSLPADRYVLGRTAASGSLPECRLCSCPGTYHRAPAVCIADIPSSHQPQQVCHPCLLITIDHYRSRSIDLTPHHLLMIDAPADIRCEGGTRSSGSEQWPSPGSLPVRWGTTRTGWSTGSSPLRRTCSSAERVMLTWTSRASVC